MTLDTSRTVNQIMIAAKVPEVWAYLATPGGWNAFLSDSAKATSQANKETRLPGDEFEPGDSVQFVIGELKNEAVCTEVRKHRQITFREKYASILPDGNWWKYELKTTFTCSERSGITTVSITVEGYTAEEMMQWIRECGEMGWRQSLFNLKCVVELGLDLRNDIFNYPRLGVLNYTATRKQIQVQGLDETVVKGNYLKKIYPGSPAEAAGLCGGDIVTSMNGQTVPTYADFVRVLSGCYGTNERVEIVFYREGVRCSTTVQLTYNDRFTGMIDPESKPLDIVADERKAKVRQLEADRKRL